MCGRASSLPLAWRYLRVWGPKTYLGGVSLALQANIVGVAAFAADQFGVFAAPDRLTDAEFGQGKRGFGGSVVHAGFKGLVGLNVPNKAGKPLPQE